MSSEPSAHRPLCSIRLFGGISVEMRDRRITRFNTQKTALLLARLAYKPGVRHPREVLIDMLWPDATPEAGRSRLSNSLTSLRRQLEPPGLPAGAIVQAERLTVCLNPETVTSDVAEFRAAISEARSASTVDKRLSALCRAIQCYTGEFLPGHYDDWVLEEQRNLQVLHERVESAYSRLKVVNAAAPVAVPSVPEREVVAFCRVSTPLYLSRFFGRRTESNLVAEWIRDGRRLISITGPGGVGKTRLSVRIAESAAPGFDSRVWFVSLATVTDPTHIAPAILDALGVDPLAGGDPFQQAVWALGQAPSFLVLDNFEQLVDQGPEIVRRLLEQCPSLSILVTSRQSLNLSGEQQIALQPFSLPAQMDDLQELAESDAVSLFLDRAQQVRPHFQLTDRNAKAIISICERLDGLPLAIELAAARAQILSPERIVDELDRRFEFLVSRRRDVEERHRSLRIALDWSYGLMPAELRPFFCSLSVFHGGCGVEAAAEVCEEPLAFELLYQLHEASMVQVDELEFGTRYRVLESVREFGWSLLPASEQKELRLRHLRYFQDLASEASSHLHGAEVARWARRLDSERANLRAVLTMALEEPDAVDFGIVLAEKLGDYWGLRGQLSEGRDWLTKLLARAQLPDSSRAALLVTTAELANRQGDFDGAQGFAMEARSLYCAAEQCGGIARAQSVLAWTAMEQGNYENARLLWGESLTRFREIDDRRGVADALSGLALNCIGASAYDEGSALLEESLCLYQQIQDKYGIAKALSYIGNILLYQGDFTEARAKYEKSLAIRKEIGDRHGVASSIASLGFVACECGDTSRARLLYEQSLAIFREIGDRSSTANSLNNLGVLAYRQADLDSARSFHGESLMIKREIGERWGIAASLNNLGSVAFEEEDYESARALHGESLEIFWHLGDRRAIAVSLEAAAAVRAAQGLGEFAARLWAAASVLRQELNARQSPAENDKYVQQINVCRASTGASAFEAAWAEGTTLTADQAVHLALQQ